MTTTSLVRAELARLTATPLARLAFIALMIVPLLYGGAYLWANRDPYAKLDQIPAAIVNLDAGATLDGDHVDYGKDVTKEAIDGADFKWTKTSAADARSGVRNGTYDFVVTIPHDFSEHLVSAQSDDPTQAKLVMTTADTNSYLASTIAEQAGKTMRTAVAERVGKQAAKTLLVGLADVRDSLGDAVDGADELASGTKKADRGAHTLADGTGKLSSGAAELASGTADLPSQTQQLNSGAQQVASGASTLASGLASAQQQTAALPSQTQQLDSGAQQLQSGLHRLRDQTASLPSDSARLSTGASQVAAGNATLADEAAPFIAGVQQLSAQSPELVASLKPVVQASTVLSEEQKTRLLAGLDDLQAGSTELGTGAGDLSGNLQKLKTGSAQVSAGASQLAEQAPALTSGIQQLSDGSDTLAAGTGKLAAKAPELSSGIADAATGASTLSSGASKVADGTSKLASAAPTLSSGASQLAAGAKTADQGASSLASGLDKLTTGSSKLASSLDEGRTKIPASNASERASQASVISDPVKVGDDNVAAASNYGAGLAPFFISLAAWIGMYALFLILKPISKRAITAVRKPLAVVFGGWLTPALLGLVQMVALFFIVRFALDLNVVHVGGTIGIMVLASATFAAIIMALNVLLGSVGQFLGLVLMLVQLVTAGGTFPWQTLPGPLAALHFALPMTYSVDAIRQTMYGGNLGAAWSDAGVLLCWLLGALLVSFVVTARQTRSRTLRDLRPSLIG
ncbi:MULTISPECIES: YhgE/Pip family protein [Curtobacterium]|uniref:YhgE/Pip family protein n=1 Tax=Curtobacterium TaxID=2034 RepID=UPI00217DEF73|nr:YhgE/Pip domain-containing protein [Curtobacterium flaccumfaciens]MCS6581657.1 YhgE/Pip domain-containing protein [Curtobacterium flaccumfaciens pv. beticola]MCS6587771.1 YhgE/Pip domain-containing protein [Curtobacterium flaccumfaciens pv. flaccumfaciens]